MNFSPEELLRYSRHLTLPEVGVPGQERLREARVLVVGAGGLGSPALLYLAAAGVGTLGIVDFDAVDLSNLQRQVLHGTASVGRLKLDSARDRLRDLNPHVRLELHQATLDSSNALELLEPWDLILDGSDNFPTRYLVNDACVLLGRRYVYGSIFRFEGQLTVFGAPGGPCYRCLFAEPPSPGLVPSCAEAGVLGVLPGIIGALQGLEALKLLLGTGDPMIGRLLLFDALKLRFRELEIRRDPGCAACGDAPTVTRLMDYQAFCGTGTPEAAAGEVTASALAGELAGSAPPLVLDVREEWEHRLTAIPGATLIPLPELPARIPGLDPRRPIVTVCHHGLRSRTAQQLLRAAGFPAVRNLAGGMDRWAVEVNGGQGRY